MKPADDQPGIYVYYGAEHNDKCHKFKVGNHLRITKAKNIFVKRHTANWFGAVFVIINIKNTVPWTYVFVISVVKRLLDHCMKKVPEDKSIRIQD